MMAVEAITSATSTLSAGLVVRFQNIWPIRQERRANKGDLHLPLHTLGTDGVWGVFDEAGPRSRARVTSVRAHHHRREA